MRTGSSSAKPKQALVRYVAALGFAALVDAATSVFARGAVLVRRTGVVLLRACEDGGGASRQ